MSAAWIAELGQMLDGTGITALTLTTPTETITLRRDASPTAHATPLPIPAPAHLAVTAPSSGVFLHRHPLRDTPLAQPGQTVQPGAVLGLLRVGPLLLHILAPRAAVVASIATPDEATVGYGTALLHLLPQDGN